MCGSYIAGNDPVREGVARNVPTPDRRTVPASVPPPEVVLVEAGPAEVVPNEEVPAEPTAHGEREPEPGVRWVWVVLTAVVVGLLAAHPKGQVLLIVFGLGMVTTIVHLTAFVAFGRCVRVPAIGFMVNFGPNLIVRRVGPCLVQLRAGPLMGGSAKFLGMDDPARPPRVPPGTRLFTDLHPVTRVAFHLAGPTALLLMAAACLGIGRAWDAFVVGFGQFFAGAVAPATVGRDLLVPFLAAVQRREWVTIAGLFAAKVTVTNVVPIPTTNGGSALTEAYHLVRGKPLSPRALGCFQSFGVLGLCALFVCWAVAGWHALRAL